MTPYPNNPHNTTDPAGESFASQAWQLNVELTHLRRLAWTRGLGRWLVRLARWAP